MSANMDPLQLDIHHAVEGDRDALERLLAHFHVTLKKEVARKIQAQFQGVVDVEDVLQVTYLEAFLAIRQLHDRVSQGFENWLRSIAEHNLRDVERAFETIKRGGGRLPLSLPDNSDSHSAFMQTVLASGTTPTQYVAREDVKTLIDEAIGTLPRDYATVVRLYDLDQCEIGVVTKTMDRSAGAVFMMRARAHDRLRHFLRPRLAGFGLCSTAVTSAT